MTTAKPKVLVVEDEMDIRQLMQMHLRREGYDVEVVEDGEKAMKLFGQSHYDLAVLDWMLPGMSGLDICKQVNGKLPVLMVTARADALDIIMGLEVGADDYVTKPFEVPVFLARVKALLRRAKASKNGEPDCESYQLGDLKIQIKEHKVWLGAEEVKLTLSEFKLLAALLQNQGRVLSREKLIGMVQGEDISVTDRTVDTHVFGLRKKIGSYADSIETIRGVGYRVRA